MFLHEEFWENLLLAFQLPKTILILWFMSFSSNSIMLTPASIIFSDSLTLILLPPSYKNPYDYIGPT